MQFDSTLALKLVPLYVLVAIGFTLGRLFRLNGAELGRLALFVLSPAVVFKGFYAARLDGRSAAIALGVFILACLAALVSLAVARRFWSDGRERILGFSTATGNTGFFGIPACLTLIGPDSLAAVVMVSFGATAYENSLGFMLVAKARNGWKQAFWRLVSYPGLHACWLGVALNLGHVLVPPQVTQTVDFLAGAYSPIGMMIVGLGLASIRGLRPDLGFMAYAFGWKFLIWPAIALAAVTLDRAWIGGLDDISRKVLLIESLAPMAAVSVVHANFWGLHPDRVALAVALSTLFALVWLPLALGPMGF